ncbi:MULTISPECIES: PTS fructose transporter subunit IIABC [Fictibacillus]|uniref:PTS fructose transporter subunit IIABC n=1 Tax=Fictibacillus TaxID=1329200 RepID=UPI001010666D|nr:MULTISPECIES: PTS fructose transporter subunit IIABC [Fictibacillus]RXY99054.1 PTS fructose transporter subunit IIABC [Fictibacillus sp. S7]WHY74672.1 fructose-specific PTS transporter subunit EIIC [Fictibacillus enclensis]
MKITELITKDTIKLNLVSKDKSSVIDELVNKLHEAGKLNDKEAYREAILAREAQSTTGIGEGIAIPHAKTAAVKTPSIAFGRSVEGVDYDALDGMPSNLFFMIAASEGANNEHLETLSKLSSYLMDMTFREGLLKAETEDEVITLINEKQVAEAAEEETEDQPVETSDDETYVVAVTACPTGIAHTYMAADALKAKANELGLKLKVETNGSSGVKNRLTSSDIEKATAVIVAADKQVEMDRFQGKTLIQVPVAQAIRNPQKLLNDAAEKKGTVYTAGSRPRAAEDGEKPKRQSAFYRHLMNGVSNMLPFVVGGGILIAISFMFGIHSADPKDPSYNQFAAALDTIGGKTAFALMVAVLAGFIARSIADSPGFAPGMVGGFLASTGNSGFLGGLIAGFLAGYIVLGLKKLFSRLPQSLEGIKPVLLYPVFGILITGLIMLFVINDPVQALNEALSSWLQGLGKGNAILVGLLLGGMMAIDMGGPINKAAFTFGIAMIDAGNFAPHAAIMAGGMVPPLGLAIATSIFRNKFTKQEREAGKTCYVMGLSFITEGAIPFAAADPGRVIPSLVAGSATAGALTMLFGIGLRAPHGGIFVVPFVEGNPFLYGLAILIGALVTALLVGFWKKPVQQ